MSNENAHEKCTNLTRSTGADRRQTITEQAPGLISNHCGSDNVFPRLGKILES